MVGKVTPKNNDDETLIDESLSKSNSDEEKNDLLKKSNDNEALNAEKKVVAMKRLTLLKYWGDEAFNASSLHRR